MVRYSTKFVDAFDMTPGAMIVFVNPIEPLYGLTFYSARADGGDIDLGIGEDYRLALAACLSAQLEGHESEIALDYPTLDPAIVSSWHVKTGDNGCFDILVQTVETNSEISPPVTYTMRCNMTLSRPDFAWLVEHLSIPSPGAGPIRPGV